MVIRDDDYVLWIAVRHAARHNLPLPEIPTGREMSDHSLTDPEFVALMKTSAARGKLFSSCKAAVLDARAVEPWADNQSY